MNYCSILSVLFLIGTNTCFAQATNKPVQSKELGEAIIQQQQLYQAKRSVRAQNMYYDFLPLNVERRTYDSLYYATRFPALDTATVRLSSLELKIASYDTSVMDILFFILQESEGDTLFYTQTIDISQLGKHHKLKLYLDHTVSIKPASFYLGYSFRLKKVEERYPYRLYANSGQEGGVILRRQSSGFTLRREQNHVFPFKAFYYKH